MAGSEDIWGGYVEACFTIWKEGTHCHTNISFILKYISNTILFHDVALKF